MAGVFTIPPGAAFVDALAAGILGETGDDPSALLDYTILLPTRRACRSLRDAFLRAGDGRAMLLPTMRPLGDVDEDEFAFHEAPEPGGVEAPPVIPALHRRLLLTRLILGWDRAGAEISVDQAARLAVELERLLDQVQTERLSFDGLKDLVPEDFAEHWQKVLAFLTILTEHWPAVVREQGGIDQAERRNLLLDSLSALWAHSPPPGHVIAAGSTGSIPATADLLATVAAMPNGRVVLPGLIRDTDSRTQEAIERDQTHPQHNLARLLRRMEMTPDAVQDWPGIAPPGPRTRLIAEVMRPAETTQAWRLLEELPAGALDGVQRVDCADSAEEAGVIALILRQALEDSTRTAALVTPDRKLARRVTAELRRWNIDIDDSAGEPLMTTAPGSFMRLIAAMVAGRFAPAPLLAVLKHPLAAGGRQPVAFRNGARLLERMVLRGPRPGAGTAGLRAAIPDGSAESATLTAFLDSLEDMTRPLVSVVESGDARLEAYLEAHVATAEALAASDVESGAERLWRGDAGEMLAQFIAELRHAAELLPPVDPGAYPALLDSLMNGATVRPRYGRHPRLAILGLLEARLQRPDLLVLGGLNEGVWPPDPQPDPWLSRPMRERFGLPLPERRIGLTAHDFVQAFAAPEIVLTRAAKTDGQPTVPSRWLTRLDAVLRGVGQENALQAGPSQWRAIRALLHQPACPVTPILPPAPRPPLAARPRRLSVTQIEAWMRDPYTIYARHILKLRPLDPLDADPGAAERGTFIHDALDQFLREYPDTLPPDALDKLLAFGTAAFGDALVRPTVRAFWWPRFERIADWFVENEAVRRGEIRQAYSEAEGRLDMPAAYAPFALTAKADRIDRLADGSYEIIDYKTGAPPSNVEVGLGYAPQLALEAVILRGGGFTAVPEGDVGKLAYWQLGGGEPPATIRPVGGDAGDLADAAEAGLMALIESFDNPDTPYAAVPRPDRAPRFNDYAHLARLREWGDG
ncbi:MAG: double-strand break repair protein AddB [Proteobacteria bacterium]|nr:double-strand break repair protein AddB [Pseudomonadota bacterium]